MLEMFDDAGNQRSTRPAPWHAIWTRSHCEQMVRDQLGAKGFDLFLPKARVWSRRSGTRRCVDAPLFPGYVFVHHELDKASHVEVLKARGVVRVLGGRWDRLTPIPDGEIEAIQCVVGAGQPVFAHAHLSSGDRVRIRSGPFEGVEGIFLRSREDRGLFVVSINMLQRSVAVEIDGTLVGAA